MVAAYVPNGRFNENHYKQNNMRKLNTTTNPPQIDPSFTGQQSST